MYAIAGSTDAANAIAAPVDCQVMRRTDCVFCIIALCLAAVAGPVGCAAGVDGEIQPVVLGLRDGLKPEGGQLLGFSDLRRERTGVHASWEIQTGMEWSAYAAWVGHRMPPGFRKGATDGEALVFHKSMPGDSLVLRIEPVSASGVPVRVRVTFDGYPN